MSDYKHEIAMLAFAIAEDEYGKDFYELPEEMQDKVSYEAMDRYTNDRVADAEHYADLMKEGEL